jgi:hypothetical protein
MNSTNVVNASIVSYISFTFLFFVLKFRYFSKTSYYWILIFLILSCALQVGQNINLTSSPELCGKPDLSLALYSTLIPWILVFTMFTLLLMIAPGWLRVFSNTFGVSAAEAYGIKGHINAVLQKPVQPGTDPALLQMLERIYLDQMSLVIELEIDDVVEEPFTFPAINRLVELKIIQPIPPEKLESLKGLYNSLVLKDTVGFFFWFILIGVFCILVSTMTLISSGCTPRIGSSYDTIFKP